MLCHANSLANAFQRALLLPVCCNMTAHMTIIPLAAIAVLGGGARTLRGLAYMTSVGFF